MLIGERTPFFVSRAALVLACAILVAACGLLSGCKESDAIIERIYDQASPNVDVDNPNKVYIIDEQAPEPEQNQQAESNEPTPWEDVSQFDLPDRTGTDDAPAVRATEYGQRNTTNNPAPQAQGGGEDKRPDQVGEAAWSDAQQPQTSADDGGNFEGGEDGPTNQDPGTNEGIRPANPDDDTYLERVYDSTYGDAEDLPSNIRTIATVGELATITQILGESGTLVGSSEDYLGREPIQTVFARKGITEVPALWSGDGATTTQADAEAIIRANPDACVVFSGQLNSDLERLILQNRPDMSVITLPKPTSALNIATEFQCLARMLSEATDGASETRANEYLDFVNSLVAEAEAAHGGGVATYASVDYNSNDPTRLATADNPASPQMWTLYISGWDDDAAVTARYESSTLFEDVGAAYTNTGWSWSPLSYYMGVGGVVNNAAAYGPLSTQLVQPVLTLNQNQVSYTWKNFCVDVDEARGGGSYPRYRAFYTLTNGRDAVDRGGINPDDLHPLGSDDFNTVIVKNSAIARALEAARQEEDGLYTLYQHETTPSASGFGRKYSGKHGESIVYSTVRGDVPYEIIVNPCGYVGSWTDGSIEAPLEATWIANRFWGLDDTVLADRISSFYETFYDGYEPDIDKILDGSYAEND